jgi:hypothetical protein
MARADAKDGAGRDASSLRHAAFRRTAILIYDAERTYRPDLLARYMAFKEVYLKEAQVRESKNIAVATAEAAEKDTG